MASSDHTPEQQLEQLRAEHGTLLYHLLDLITGWQQVASARDVAVLERAALGVKRTVYRITRDPRFYAGDAES